jgi:hypothetical protein
MTQEEQRATERRDDRSHDRWRYVYPLAAVFASIFVVVFINIAYTHEAVRQDQQNWCALIVGIDNRYQTTPPKPNDTGGIEFANDIHNLRSTLKCR